MLKLHAIAERYKDPEMMDFLECEFLKEQIRSIKQFADYLTEAERVGPGLGEYLLDKLTLKE
ncbi:unnamed protein product [Protopolystoma xenopodis]|uniref:Ferritin n=1 Tax=Protopolystoma xenopodis TaxID=117903 RepID=A0A448XPG4_9PLAT|nr:unnamed protein product [Protopolystoma xenopodis]